MDTRTRETVTRVFYCDPLQTNQKSGCERNHEYIRYILPKSTSFDHLSREDVRLIMNHINSTPRGSMNMNTPYKKFVEIYGTDVAAKLGLEEIPLSEICLLPDLVKAKKEEEASDEK